MCLGQLEGELAIGFVQGRVLAQSVQDFLPESQFPGIRDRVLTERGEIREHVNLAVSLALIVRNSLAYNLLSVIASR
jgi:hypothetical protein